ncbi:ligand-binding protein SH3 [Bacillus sp. MUM 116]|uniref:DMT family transporter n=1 Tax=Bacillus sp. MUM 116 TaxID=1678002 RepID=UPI0008F57BF1|nr:SMR family transporter [Bacillus sp. MUM 116]OIK07627.1 ligand-binding protein SH3 [Bacillus sp. MUM 116]
MMNRSWIYVILTCVSEVLWIYGFHNATTWWHWIFIAGFILLDLQFLAKACENLPTGTVYAIFAGAGTVGTFLMDVFLFNEHVSIPKIFFIILVICGVVGLKLSDDKKSKGVNQ